MFVLNEKYCFKHFSTKLSEMKGELGQRDSGRTVWLSGCLCVSIRQVQSSLQFVPYCGRQFFG